MAPRSNRIVERESSDRCSVGAPKRNGQRSLLTVADDSEKWGDVINAAKDQGGLSWLWSGLRGAGNPSLTEGKGWGPGTAALC